MKRKQLLLLLTVILSIPTLALAQSSKGYKYADDNATVFVNTEAFGVHKEYDRERGCEVWKDSMGSFLCLDKNMKPLSEMDKHVHFTGSNNDPDNPEVSPFSGIRKEWDRKRGCYVWKNVYTGDFLGTDKSSVHQQEKANQQAKKKEQNQQKPNTGKKDQHDDQHQAGKDNNGSNSNSQTWMITSDEELRQAEAAIREAKAQVAAAKAQGVDVNQYAPVDEYIRQAENAINEYKRRNKR